LLAVPLKESWQEMAYLPATPTVIWSFVWSGVTSLDAGPFAAKQVSFAGDVPTQAIALAIAILLVIVFGISFLVEKTIDLFLGLLGLGPVVLIVAAAALIQGFLIGLHVTDHHGLLNLLGG